MLPDPSPRGAGEYRPLRVLAVVNSLVLGGAERTLERTVLALSRQGLVEYTVCTLGEAGPIGTSLRRAGIEVRSLGLQENGLASIAAAAAGVRRLLRQRRFDLMHSVLYRSHCATRLARLWNGLRPPLVSAEHCTGGGRGRLLLLVNSLMSPLSSRIAVVSEAVLDEVARRDWISRRKVAMVRNGIEVPRRSSAAGGRLRRRLGIPPGDAVFLMLGRLHREKGPDVLIDALRLLAARRTRGWRVLVVGAGPEEGPLRARVREQGLQKRVFVAGARRYVAPWLEAADALVLPSREEGLPVSALEAMARGRPVVATRVGGTAEAVVDGESGLLVPPESPAALADAMACLIREPALREAMGKRARARVEAEFSLQAMVGATLRCYQEALAEQRARGDGRRRCGLALRGGSIGREA
jgi:glycosyltransferase involved in cell wall biosynthesis